MSLALWAGASFPGCRSSSKGPLLANGPLPTDYTVQVVGIGREPADAPSGRARLMAEAAAEADAQRRLVEAILGRPDGSLKDVRRISARRLEGGWCAVTAATTLPSLEDYVIALDRLQKMDPSYARLLRVVPKPKVVETYVPPLP